MVESEQFSNRVPIERTSDFLFNSLVKASVRILLIISVWTFLFFKLPIPLHSALMVVLAVLIILYIFLESALVLALYLRLYFRKKALIRSSYKNHNLY